MCRIVRDFLDFFLEDLGLEEKKEKERGQVKMLVLVNN